MDDTHLPDPTQDTPTRARHAVPGQASESFSPLSSTGQAGQGAAELSDRIAKAHEVAPTSGRDFASRAYARGAIGEEAVAENLRWLNGEHFHVLHDQPWPGRPKANIDHIVIGVTGIFVVDAKNWSGEITTTQNGLRQNGTVRNNAIVSAQRQAEALSQLLTSIGSSYPKEALVLPVLAFFSDEVATSKVANVGIVSAKNIAEFIGDRKHFLAAEHVKSIAQALKESLDLDRSLELTNLKESQSEGRAKARAARVKQRSQETPVRIATSNGSRSSRKRTSSSAASGSKPFSAFAPPVASTRVGGPEIPSSTHNAGSRQPGRYSSALRAPADARAISGARTSGSKKRSTGRPRKSKQRSNASSSLIKLVAILGALYFFTQNPEILTDVVQKIGSLVSGSLTSSVQGG